MNSTAQHAPPRAGHYPPRRPRTRGAGMVETLLAVIALVPVVLGIVQGALVYNAKSIVNYAAFEAARAGALSHAQAGPMQEALTRYLLPFYGGGKEAASLSASLAAAHADLQRPVTASAASGAGLQLRILNPTREAFEDFGVQDAAGRRYLPNDHLKYRSREVGQRSGVSLHDANLLKIEVTYGYRLFVPLVNRLIGATLAQLDPAHASYYLSDPPRLPLQAFATVRLQSPAYEAGNEPVSDGGEGGSVPGSGGQVPANPTPPSGGNPVTVPGGGSTPAGNSAFWNEKEKRPSADKVVQEKELVCTEPVPVTAGKEETKSWWGAIEWGWDFLRGVASGYKKQVEDLIKTFTDLKGTWDEISTLAKALYEKPQETIEALVTAIGEDLKKDYEVVTECGAYDIGQVFAKHVSPAKLVNFAKQLVKFGGDPKLAAAELKKIGCASFAPGTRVWANEARLPIEALRTGTMVASRSDETYTDAPQAIIRTFGRISPEYYRLTTEFETLDVTPEHPFYVQGRGWTQVKDIEAGQALVTATGDTLVLDNVPIDQPLRVHNFSVATTPSYFVGESGVWVHNAKCDDGGPNQQIDALPGGTRFSAGFAKHVIAGDGFSRKNGVSGAHNKDEFMKYSSNFQIDRIETTSVPGIEKIYYKVPLVNGKGDPIGGDRMFEPKTVFDPASISNAQFLEMVVEAATDAERTAGKLVDGLHTGFAKGVRFRIRVKNGEIVTTYPQLDDAI